jgi:hypothetical protein
MGTIQIDGSTPKLTIGNATAEDALILFDGNAQDFYIGLDDSADDLIIGLGSAVGTTPAISINEDRDVTISDGAIDFDIASHDTSNGLKLGGTLVTATAAELNIMDGVTSTAAEINLIDGGTARGTTALADGDGILINDAGTMRMTTVQTVKTYMGTTFNGIDDTSSSFDDCVTITDNEVVINEDGDNQDFRVESDDLVNFFFCDASANKAGFSKHDRSDMGFIHITTASSGASSPDAGADELILEGSGHCGMTIFSGTSNSGSVYFGDSGGAYRGYVEYSHNTDELIIGSGDNASIRCDANGHVTMPRQSAFFGNITSAVNNETGDNTRYSYIPNELADRNGDFSTSTFTAPVAGLYLATVSHNLAGITSMESGTGMIATSNRTHYWNFNPNNLANAAGSIGFSQSQIVDMDASDTLTFDIRLTGGSKVADIEDTTTMAVFLLG